METNQEIKPWEQFQQSAESLKKPTNAITDGGGVPPWEAIKSSISNGTAFITNAVMPNKVVKETKTSEVIPVSDDVKFEKVFKNLIKQESGGKHADASGKLTTSPVGAQGVTQVMPKTGRDPGYGVAPVKDSSEKEYLRFGRDYLQAMVKEFNGDYHKALAAYNAGAGSVKKAVLKAAKAGDDNWQNHLPKTSETVPYIRNIMKGIR